MRQIARTCLQDTVDISFAGFFDAAQNMDVVAAVSDALALPAMTRTRLDPGEPYLKVRESPTVFAALKSMELLETVAWTLAKKCFAGIIANVRKNEQNTRTIIPLLTELMKTHGYSAVSHVCHEAGGDPATLRKRLKEAFGEG